MPGASAPGNPTPARQLLRVVRWCCSSRAFSMSFSGCDTRRARDDCERGACDRHALGVNAQRQPTAGAFRLADCERSWRRVQSQRRRDSVARRTAQAFEWSVPRTIVIGTYAARDLAYPPNVLGVSCTARPACRSQSGAAVAANDVRRTESRTATAVTPSRWR